MAKRFNIIRNIKEEIKKGNTYLASNGNFVSAEMLHTEILNNFKRELTDGTLDLSVPFDQYREKALAEYTNVKDLLDGICEAFNLVDNFTTEENEKDHPGELSEESDKPMNEPTTEEQETSEKPKRTSRKKGSDV